MDMSPCYLSSYFKKHMMMGFHEYLTRKRLALSLIHIWFYDVYEGVQLVQLESPPIVSGVPDMHPSDSQNVEETRNLMQTSNW